MNTISFCGAEYDPVSPLVFWLDETRSNFGERKRRVNKTTALNQQVVFQDLGYTESDRELLIVVQGASKQSIDDLQTLLEIQGQCVVNWLGGCFQCRMVSILTDGTDNSIKLYIEKDLTK